MLELIQSQLTPVDQNPAAVYLGRLAPKSRRTMGDALERIAQIASSQSAGMLEFPWSRLRYQHTAAIRVQLAEQYAPATANRMLSALRGVLKEAWRLGLVEAEAYHQAADLKNIKSSVLPSGRALGGEEVQALFEACADETSAGMRDAGMLGVLRSGLRRFEVVSLDLSDLDGIGGLKVRAGKGRKDRQVYLTEMAQAHLRQWVALRGGEAGPLFLPINKGGRIVQRRLSDEAVRTILLKRIEQASLNHHSPHDWRRTFISDLLDAGADISTVQQLAGHSNPATTVRYDRRGEATKQKAISLLN